MHDGIRQSGPSVEADRGDAWKGARQKVSRTAGLCGEPGRRETAIHERQAAGYAFAAQRLARPLVAGDRLHQQGHRPSSSPSVVPGVSRSEPGAPRPVLLRQRMDPTSIIQRRGLHDRMQKALVQMNLQLPFVISDITGQTGLKIIRAIVAGERDPAQLARFRHGRCRATPAEIRGAHRSRSARYCSLCSNRISNSTRSRRWHTQCTCGCGPMFAPTCGEC